MSTLHSIGTVANNRSGGSALFLLGNKRDSLPKRPIGFSVSNKVRQDLGISEAADEMVPDNVLTVVIRVGAPRLRASGCIITQRSLTTEGS